MQSRFITGFQRCWPCLPTMQPPRPSFRSASGGVRNLALKIVTAGAKNRGEMLQFNNSKSIWKNYTYAFHNTKHPFCCSIFRPDYIDVPKNDDKTINVVAPIQTLWAAGFAPHRQTLRVTAYRHAREMGISNNFNDETHTAGFDCWTFVFSLSSKNDHNTVGTFL